MKESFARVSEFRHGETLLFRMEPLNLRHFRTTPPKEAEIFVKATDDGELLIAWSAMDAPEPVKCKSPRDHEKLVLALNQGIQFFAWAIDVEQSRGEETLLIEIRLMSAGVAGADFILGVDEKIHEQLSGNLKQPDLSFEDACLYLYRDFNFKAPEGLPAGMSPDFPARWVARRDHSGATGKSSSFRLLGANHAIDIQRREDTGRVFYFVERLIWAPKVISGGSNDPLLLLQGDLTFEDATVAANLASAYPSLNSLLSESDSYLDIWDRFQDLEISKLKDKMASTGAFSYKNRRFDEIRSCWVFELSNAGGDLSKELDSLWNDGEVEANKSAPDVENWTPVRQRALEPQAPITRDSDKSFYGRFIRADYVRGEIHLEKPESDTNSNSQAPPEKGWLYLRWRGSQVQIKRRKQAMERLLDPLRGIPSLIHLLQGLPVPHRRLYSAPAMSPAAKGCFRGGNPTERQVEAIKMALNTPDIAIIQGPPGTGKTRTIAALVQRLNDLATKKDAVSKRFLLTSFQHDAVETVANATSLMELPAIKFGRRGRQSDQSYEKTALDHWIDDLGAKIEVNLANLAERPVSAVLRKLRDIRTAYGESPGDDHSTVLILRDLKDYIQGIVRDETISNLRQLIQNLGNKRLPTEHEDSNLRRALSGIRWTPEAFSDDGPRGCFRLLNCTDTSRFLPEERKALEDGANWDSEEVPPFLDTLALLHERLLQEITSPRLEHRALLPNAGVCSVLEAIDNELELTIRLSPTEGPAAALESFLDELKQDPASGKRALERYSALLAATCQGAGAESVMVVLENEESQFDTVIVDEAARANPLDLMIPMSLAGRRVILVGDHRQLPHLLEPDVEKELTASANEETEKAIRQSLFERLFNHVRELESRDGVKRCVTLDRQYRMHPLLADLVNTTFYKPHGESFGSPDDATFSSSFQHEVAEAKGKLVLWKSVPLAQGREWRPRNGFSWMRREEAVEAAATARKILQENPDLSIGIITFYSAQVVAIMEELSSMGIAVRSEDSERPVIAPNFAQFPPGVTNRFNDSERLRVGTVDAFQGKEFDVVILSPVRSNALKIHEIASGTNNYLNRKFGHLLLSNRMCVALSRQRRLLIVVGDDAMFRQPVISNENVDSSELDHPVPGLPEVLLMSGGDHGIYVPATYKTNP
jgi:hypothetical protein